jgi:phosphoglycerol transferase MdoB-like AlkP superfamily enzyme
MSRIIPSRILRWSIYTGFFFLILMSILRLSFFIWFRHLGLSWKEAGPSFLLGLRYDLRMVCVLMIALMILGSIIYFHPYRNTRTRRGWFFLLGLISTAFVLFYIIDFVHYAYLSQRLNASVLNYTKDAGISLVMVWQSYPVVKLLFLLLVLVIFIIFSLRFLYKRASPHGAIVRPQRRLVHFLIAFLLFAIGIFGRVGQYPLRWSYAFSMGNEAKANLSLNPFQSFFSTLKFRSSTYDLQKTKAYYPLMASQLGISQPDPVNLNFSRSYPANDSFPGIRPNVVIVICESFSAYKSSMWGNPLNTTPFFKELCDSGVFFNHCFTPTWGTARGVWCTITGIPDVETPRTASRNMGMVSQHSIMNDFDGYEKFYFIGGSTSWANIRGLLKNNIDSLHLYEGDDYKSPKVDVWGISDKNLFLEANNVLKQQSRPFIAVIQTADNHRPYTIPAEDRDQFQKVSFPQDTLNKYGFESNGELNAFRYTDFGYSHFINAARKEPYFANTIFVFVGDHGIRGNTGDMFPKAWSEQGLSAEHVPLLFYSPALLKTETRTVICSQADIMASAAGLTGIAYRNSSLGRNLFDEKFMTDSSAIRSCAFTIDPDLRVIGMVDSEYYFTRSLISGKEQMVSIRNNEALIFDEKLKARREKLKDLANAYYETSYYLLLNNKRK